MEGVNQINKIPISPLPVPIGINLSGVEEEIAVQGKK